MWELRGHGSAAPPTAGDGLPPWFSVGLVFADGTRIELLAQVREGRVLIEDMRADPPLPVDGFGTLPDWLAEPLRGACKVVTGQYGGAAASPAAEPSPTPAERAEQPERADDQGESTPAAQPPRHRAGRRRSGGRDGRRTAAEAYLAAQREGTDPVLAVMCATGRSRRRSLKLIAAARDKGYLTPRHVRR
ncbi:DUF6214 family protein [Streptomyces sp. NBC_01803]|uniref:DUF6214 family protein n=1 Tax=Streptomyces sp. NBC_01803 TaxID=2975946 RepID=UPI002DD85866|nr:DUF6214 family protein [Streptomyces sp. NBC_01803]WSA42862.1 DUF6214 family protein [Streptomyces sp. NBC_01803]